MSGVKIIGLEETQRKLSLLPNRIQKRANTKAVRAGGAVFLKAARAAAPRRTGLLARSLTQKIKAYRSTVVAIVGQSVTKNFGKGAETAKRKKGRGGLSGRGQLVPIHLVERPVRPHVIPGPVKIFGRVVSNVRHPGHRGQHFLRRTSQQARGGALQAFRAKLTTEVETEAKKS